MMISVTEQIIEAELHRRALEKAAIENPALLPRLHRSEAICLTLAVHETHENEFREFMKSRKDVA